MRRRGAEESNAEREFAQLRERMAAQDRELTNLRARVAHLERWRDRATNEA